MATGAKSTPTKAGSAPIQQFPPASEGTKPTGAHPKSGIKPSESKRVQKIKSSVGESLLEKETKAVLNKLGSILNVDESIEERKRVGCQNIELSLQESKYVAEQVNGNKPSEAMQLQIPEVQTLETGVWSIPTRQVGHLQVATRQLEVSQVGREVRQVPVLQVGPGQMQVGEAAVEQRAFLQLVMIPQLRVNIPQNQAAGGSQASTSEDHKIKSTEFQGSRTGVEQSGGSAGLLPTTSTVGEDLVSPSSSSTTDSVDIEFKEESVQDVTRGNGAPKSPENVFKPINPISRQLTFSNNAQDSAIIPNRLLNRLLTGENRAPLTEGNLVASQRPGASNSEQSGVPPRPSVNIFKERESPDENTKELKSSDEDTKAHKSSDEDPAND